MIPHICQRIAQAPLAFFEIDQLELRADQVRIGRQDGEVRDLGRPDRGARLNLTDQRVIDRGRTHGIPRDPETARRVALGIEIDEQDPLLCHGERGGHVHCRGGLADAALLVRDRENRPQGHPPHLIPASRPRTTEC